MNDHKDPNQPLGERTDAASVVRLTQPEYRVFTEGRPFVERTLGRAVACMPFEECAPSEADSQKRLTSFFRVIDETAADLHVTTVGATARPVTSRIHHDASPDTGERELDGLREMFFRPAMVLFRSPVRLRGVRKFIAGVMRPRDGNSSGALRGVTGRQSGHLTHRRSRSQAGS